MRLTLRLAATIGAGALLAACSSGTAVEDPTASETTTASASPTASDSPSPTETSPSETETEGMTVEEAQEIVDATTAVYNDAVIRMLTEQRIGQEWIRQMESIYQDHMVDLLQQAWVSAASREFEDYNTTDPTGVRDEVLDVVHDEGSCFVVNIRRDFSGVTAPDSENALGVSDDYYISFSEVDDPERDGAGTGWIRTWDLSSADEPLTDLCDREPPSGGGSGS